MSIASLEPESAKARDRLRREVESLADVGASELFVDVRSLPQETLSLWCGAAASVFPGRLTVLAEPTTVEQAQDLLASGASRLAVQDAALDDPSIIGEVKRRLGSDSLAVMISARCENEIWRVYKRREGAATEWDAVTWARVAEAQGAGELIVEMPPVVGVAGPYDLDLLCEITRHVDRPVVAFGQSLSIEACLDALVVGNADAVLLTPPLGLGRGWLEAIRRYLEEYGVSCS